MAYATPTDLTARKDRNTVADLASDTGVQSANLDVDPNVLAALEDASGAIEAALRMGGMYSPADLASLDDHARSMLVRMTCDIAMAYLFDRRPGYQPEAYEKAMDRAEKILGSFRKGELVFGLPAQQAAGLPTVDGPSAVDYDRLNSLVDRTKNYYPQRGTRLPIGRG